MKIWKTLYCCLALLVLNLTEGQKVKELVWLSDGFPHPIIIPKTTSRLAGERQNSGKNNTAPFYSFDYLRGFETDTIAVKVTPGTNISMLAKEYDLQAEQIGTMESWFHLKSNPGEVRPIGKIGDDARVVTWYRETERLLQSKQFTDPSYADQWHLKNTGQNGGLAGEDINVVSAWDSKATGQGVLIQVVDTGVDFTHPDLKDKYVPSASFDVNDNDNNPSPTATSDTHGTACAGLIVAGAGNGVCGVGVAFNARFAAVKLVSAPVSSSTQATSLIKYAIETGVAVSSNSWGYQDTGVNFDVTACIMEDARKRGVTEGRNGKGISFVWAAGNGNLDEDNCNHDELSHSPYIITVGASDAAGKQSSYSERCAGMLVNAGSSSGPFSKLPSMVTTALRDSCRSDFGGTSAATPVVAGVVGLLYEVNPSLTYRDVMHILVATAKVNDPTDSGWDQNGAGLKHNHKYGFGRVDASKAVSTAKQWKSVGTLAVFSKQSNMKQSLGSNKVVQDTIDISITGSIEHVNVYLSIEHDFPNELEIVLISPAGTRSELTAPHNAGVVPVITLASTRDSNFLGRYTSFSPAIKSKITATTIQFSRTDTSCGNLYPLDTDTPLDSLSNMITVIPYDESCDAGKLARIAESKGAPAVWFYTNYRTITGSSGVTIPCMFIPISLGNTILDNADDSGRLEDRSWSIIAQKFPIGGTLHNNYRMMTVRNWGEQPKGSWKLQVSDRVAGDEGTLVSWKLELYGQLSASNSGSVSSCSSKSSSRNTVEAPDSIRNSYPFVAPQISLVAALLCLFTILH